MCNVVTQLGDLQTQSDTLFPVNARICFIDLKIGFQFMAIFVQMDSPCIVLLFKIYANIDSALPHIRISMVRIFSHISFD